MPGPTLGLALPSNFLFAYHVSSQMSIPALQCLWAFKCSETSTEKKGPSAATSCVAPAVTTWVCPPRPSGSAMQAQDICCLPGAGSSWSQQIISNFWRRNRRRDSKSCFLWSSLAWWQLTRDQQQQQQVCLSVQGVQACLTHSENITKYKGSNSFTQSCIGYYQKKRSLLPNLEKSLTRGVRNRGGTMYNWLQ